MSRQKFIILLVIMIVATMGIISAQLLLLNQLKNYAHEDFNKRVLLSFKDLDQDIARGETILNLKGELQSIDSIINKELSVHFMEAQKELNSAAKTQRKATQEQKKAVESLKALESLKVLKEIKSLEDLEKLESLEQLGELEKLKDLKTEEGDTFKFTFSETGVPGKPDVHIEISNVPEEKDSLRIEGVNWSETENIMTHAIYEKIHDFLPFEERLNELSLDSLIQKNLLSNGIQSCYQFAVFNADSDSLIYGALPAPEVIRNQGAFEHDLFNSDVYQPSKQKLVLSLENELHFILKTLSWPIFISIAFTLLVLLAFYLSLNYLMKQKRISQIKSDFINNMTHEFKTPLSSISIATSSIVHPNTIKDENKIKAFTKIIQNEQKRLSQQINRILEIAQLDKDELQLNIHDFELESCVDQMAEAAQMSVEEVGGTFELIKQGDLSHFSGDEHHLCNIISTLIDNSVKYRGQDLKVVLQVSIFENTLYLTVRDNGIGMSKQQLDLACTPFYRSQSGNIHKVKGFGLGLSYVKGMVDLMHGQLQIKSQLHKGTEVNIKIESHE